MKKIALSLWVALCCMTAHAADGKSLFVPYTLAGETVDVDLQGGTARLNRILTPSPDRVEPVFGLASSSRLIRMESTSGTRIASID